VAATVLHDIAAPSCLYRHCIANQNRYPLFGIML
jgi:hypothetical protein